MRIIQLRQGQFWQKCTCNLNVYFFYVRFALEIIHDDRSDRKTPKQLFYSSKTPFSVVKGRVTVLYYKWPTFTVKKSIVKKYLQNITKWYLRVSSLMSTIYFLH